MLTWRSQLHVLHDHGADQALPMSHGYGHIGEAHAIIAAITAILRGSLAFPALHLRLNHVDQALHQLQHLLLCADAQLDGLRQPPASLGDTAGSKLRYAAWQAIRLCDFYGTIGPSSSSNMFIDILVLAACPLACQPGQHLWLRNAMYTCE